MNGNGLCAYVNAFNYSELTNVQSPANVDYTGITAVHQAVNIMNWYHNSWWIEAGPEPGEPTEPRSGSPVPGWIFLNEVSRDSWPKTGYAEWVTKLVEQLDNSGFRVVVFSPFTLPATYAPSGWEAIATHAYIAIESYLSGSAIQAHADDEGGAKPWCKEQYSSMISSYERAGVPGDKLFLTEHFGQTFDGNPGRAGVTKDEWLAAIDARSQAATELFAKEMYAGYATYAWNYNQMNKTVSDLVKYEQRYVSHQLPEGTGAAGA